MENLKRFYINGEWVDPKSDQTMLVIAALVGTNGLEQIV